MRDYSYIKEKYRQPLSAEAFRSVKFHRAPILKVRLSWAHRWGALARLLNPRWGFWTLFHEFGVRVAEFRTGWRYEIGVK